MGKILKLVKTLSWKEYLSEFITERKIRGCRETTIKDYIKFINYFFRSYSGEIDDYEHLHYALRKYFSKPCAPASFNLKRAYLKAFFSFLVKEGILLKKPN